jgi:hypothetical protein
VIGAVGGNSVASNIPHYSAKPKPGPASSKPGPGNKMSKGSNDPIKLYNKYGSLDSMDQEVNISPRSGPGSRRNP